MSYQLTTEGYVIRLSDGAKIATTDTPDYPNTNPDYLVYRDWLDVGGVPEPADLEALRAQKLAAINATYYQHVRSFPWDFGGDVGVQHLQVRDTQDQANWLLVRGEAQERIAAGQGDAPGMFIVTEENNAVPVTAVQAQAVMSALAAFGFASKANQTSLKAAVRAAQTHAALAAIDITAGWPE